MHTTPNATHDAPVVLSAPLGVTAPRFAPAQAMGRPRQILIDVSQLAKVDFAAGIQRVVKNVIAQWLQQAPPAGYEFRLVAANYYEKGYFYCDVLRSRITPNLALKGQGAGRGATSHDEHQDAPTAGYNSKPQQARYDSDASDAGQEPGAQWAMGAPLPDTGTQQGRRRVVADELISFAAGDVFVGLDLDQHTVSTQSDMGTYAEMRAAGVCVTFVAYDVLPISLKHRFWPSITGGHAAWLRVLSENDGVLCISKTVAQEVQDYYLNLEVQGKLAPPRAALRWFHLGADPKSKGHRNLSNSERELLQRFSKKTSFLMVSTIEPRKGHLLALNAFETLWAKDQDINLVIVGKYGWGIPQWRRIMHEHPEAGKRLFWLEGIDDTLLNAVYANTHCLIAASEGEGFGLPLIEAAQHKLPIIARDIPVFWEVAGKHAMYFSARFGNQLAEVIEQWLERRLRGSTIKSKGIVGQSWAQSAAQLLHQVMGIANGMPPEAEQVLAPSIPKVDNTIPAEAAPTVAPMRNGIAALDLTDWQTAWACAEQVRPYLPLLPKHHAGYFYGLTGLAYLGQEEYKLAIGQLRLGIAKDPGNPWLYFHMGRAYKALEQDDLAATAFAQALELEYHLTEAHIEVGKYYHRRGEYAKAWEHYSVAVKAGGLTGRGSLIVLAQAAGYAKDYALAERYYTELAVDENGQPDYYQRWVWSFQKFAIGDFESAWAMYDDRHRVSYVAQSHAFIWPRWQGPQSANTGPLLIHGEQGLGDEIMFAASLPRLLNDCAAVGQQVVLAVKPGLTRLFAHNFPQCRVVPHHHNAHQIAPLQPEDIAVQYPLANLPTFYCKDLEGFAQNRKPYLRATNESIAKFANLLDQFSPNWQNRIRVGLVWTCAQGKSPELDARAIPLPQWAPYFDDLDVMFVSLHNTDHSHEVLQAPSMRVLDLGQWQDDFEDTAGLIHLMDVVVGVDTATTHLAGAMGKLVLQPLVRYPDWRRITPGDDCIWYNNTRYYRQTHLGQWANVLQAMATDLKTLHG